MSDLNATVAVIGLGRMGAAMAGTLSRTGLHPVLWNRTPSVALALGERLDVPVAATAAEAVSGADIVLSSLADDAAVLDVYRGHEGLTAGLNPGTLVLDTSTIAPETVHLVGAAVDDRGAEFLDCPVSGSVTTVEAGALTIMVGGDAELIDRAKVVLEPLSAKIVHTGPRGSGAATKLAVNGLVHGLNVALSEAVVLAERAGVDRTTAYEVFASGAGGAPFVQYKRRAYESPETADVAFSLDLVAKDLDLITSLARGVGAPMRQAETGLEIVRDAIEAGLGHHDLSAIAVYLRGEGDR